MSRIIEYTNPCFPDKKWFKCSIKNETYSSPTRENDRWIFLSDLDSGEFLYNNKSVKVFTTDRGYKFFQTKWGNTTIQNISWDNCKDTINDRIDNEAHYHYMEQLSSDTIGEMYRNNHNNWTGD